MMEEGVPWGRGCGSGAANLVVPIWRGEKEGVPGAGTMVIFRSPWREKGSEIR